MVTVDVTAGPGSHSRAYHHASEHSGGPSIQAAGAVDAPLVARPSETIARSHGRLGDGEGGHALSGSEARAARPGLRVEVSAGALQRAHRRRASDLASHVGTSTGGSAALQPDIIHTHHGQGPGRHRAGWRRLLYKPHGGPRPSPAPARAHLSRVMCSRVISVPCQRPGCVHRR